MVRASPGDDEIKDVGNRLACSFISWASEAPYAGREGMEKKMLTFILF